MKETGEDIVLVKVKRKTREELKFLGKKGDTYDDVISALLNTQTRRGEE